ncbi:MAG: pyridoxamine 5'-phosphate oxidase [Chloroflexota bacterium]|nr:MAG: pyridoxamine 5'-phosphate oxidase [Chloroflexota bacterium]
MPASYGIHPTPNADALDWDVVSAGLASARNYWVVTAGPDRRPHSVPVWGLWLDETFYFATERASRKGRNLAANPALVVHLESGDDVVILEGTAEDVSDPSLLSRFADAYEAKYQLRPDIANTAQVVYALRPRLAHTWLEQDFPGTAVRWRFD